jgi:tetratricopeptide (TPR) repeat protein
MKPNHVCLLWVTLLMALLVVAPVTGQQITNVAEYNDYMASLNEKTPATKLQLLDQFLTKYPDTVVKEDALTLKMFTLQQLGKSPEPAARQVLEVNPNNLRALFWVSYFFHQGPPGPNDPEMEKKLSEGGEFAQRGVKQLSSFQVPNVSAEDLEKQKNAFEATFRQALGVVADIRKKYDEAQSEYRRAAELSPQDAGLFYRLGNAYIAQRPDPKYNEAFWAFARAATLDGPTGLQPAGRQQVDAYLQKIYEQYHGPDEEGLAQLKQHAKAQPFPPTDFKVLSKAEVIAAAPVIPEELSFREIRDMLLKGDAKGKELKEKIEGVKLEFPRGGIISATGPRRARTVRLVVLPETAQRDPEKGYDVEMILGAPTRRVPVGKLVRFEGIVNSYQEDPFVLSIVDGKILPLEEE